MKRPGPAQLDGLLVLHKPAGPTSTDCLNSIKRALGQKKIGHAGTLDPMATGVLVVLLGQGTKLAPYLSEGRKTYRGELLLGQTTDTYDIQGQILSEAPWEHLSADDIRAAVLGWQDETRQEVPPVSAAKHQGRPLYALHRAGWEVPVKTRDMTIFGVEILSVHPPRVSFRVICSAGTYIRSLAHSLGRRLGCGAALSELEREASHPFTLDQAHGLETVLSDPERFASLVQPLAQSLPHWPRLRLTGQQAGLVRNGAWLPASLFPAHPAEADSRAMFLAPDGAPLALAEVKKRGQDLCWSILRGLWQA